MTLLLQKYREQNKNTAFVLLTKKVFDQVQHVSLMDYLERIKIHQSVH